MTVYDLYLITGIIALYLALDISYQAPKAYNRSFIYTDFKEKYPPNSPIPPKKRAPSPGAFFY